MTLDIRLTPPDHPQVLALIEALDAFLASKYAPEHNHILDLASLRLPGVSFLGAWDGAVLAGCGAVRLMPAEPAAGDRPYGEIKRMFVSPLRRGAGVGRQLLGALEDVARRQGVAQALLETGEELVEAVRLYRAQGYVTRAAFGGYPDNGVSLFMEKRWTTP